MAVGDAPTKGGKQPKVTIVAFSEFQCPFCSRVNPTIEQLVEGLRRRRQRRVPAQPAAVPQQRHDRRRSRPRRRASRASSGRCTTSCSPTSRRSSARTWRSTPRSSASTWASSRPPSTSEKGKERIKRDMDDAAKFGARGTPNFFINGRNLRGAQPLEAFKGVIDEEIKKADAKLDGGHAARQALRGAHQGGPGQGGRRRRPPPGRAGRETPLQGRAQARAGEGRQGRAGDHRAVLATSSARSAAGSSRPSTKVMKEYKGKVRVAWRDLPLPFHPNAMPAAIAARAAGEQGKFWEMHDKLFANQQHLDRASLREVRPGARPQHGQVQGRARREEVQGRRSRPTPPRATRSARAERPPSSSTASSCRARSRSSRSRRRSTRS